MPFRASYRSPASRHAGKKSADARERGRRRYVDAEGLVTLKGRVAAEVQSADELLLTELLFTGVFQARASCPAAGAHPKPNHSLTGALQARRLAPGGEQAALLQGRRTAPEPGRSA